MKIGFTDLLAIVFITLKLTGYIGWSWLWVLSPLWIVVAVWATIVLVGVAAALVCAVVSE